MKRLLWIMLLLTSCTTYGQPSRATIDQWHEIHAEQQRIAQKTLEMFPDTWQEFLNLYGWDSRKEPHQMPFYNRSLNDAEYLYHCSSLIDYDLFLHKVFSLAAEASWDADHVSQFQHVVRSILQSWTECLPHLNRYSEQEALNFWKFVLASPAMENMIPLREEYEQLAKQTNYRHSHLIIKAFAENEVQFAH
mgnify:FL=1